MSSSYRVRIGLREIAAMQPNTILWDQEVKGFVARRQHSDVVTFSVVYRTKENVQRWQKLARFPILTPSLARKEAIRVLRAKALGFDPAAEKIALRTGISVAQLCDEYSARENGKKQATIKSDDSRIKLHIKPKLGKLRVAAVTGEQVEDFMHSLSRGSAARCVGLLGTIFSYALKKKLCAVNPCHGIEIPADVKKTRRLSEIEYPQLQKAISGASNSTMASVVNFLVVSGWRSGEVCQLKWDELDIERHVVTLSDTKTGKSIRPLSCAAIEIIKRQERTNEYVFAPTGKPIGHLSHLFAKLGMSKEVTPHVLRHSYASLAGDLGLPDHTIARLLGHSQSSITSRYIHMEKSVIEASDLVANETLRLMRH